MYQSEKKSLVRFLILYLSSTLLLFSLASWIFYTTSKQQIIEQQRSALKYEAEHIISKLRLLHASNNQRLIYPYSPMVHSAIYDKDKKYIFGTFESKQTLHGHRNHDLLYDISRVEPYYLGAAYLLTSKKLDAKPIENLQKNIGLFMIAAGILLSILGYFLGRLFVAPMRESLERMNHFIQDTTHELNTPISTILTNIEMIETFGKYAESKSELNRIEIASKTLSRIYDDLSYLNLNHQYHRNIECIDFSLLVEERISYFTSMAKAKEIKIVCNIIAGVQREMDKNDALRLIDNLFSNAIKYNKYHGKLEVILTHEILMITDTGIGISKEDLKQIFQRFHRVNKSEGGFGIGLHIVSAVCDNYGFGLEMNSKINEGTKVGIRWVK